MTFIRLRFKNCWIGNNDFQSRDERSNSKIRSIPRLNPGNPNLTFRISWDRQCPLALNYYQFQVLGQQFQAKVYVTLNSPHKFSKDPTVTWPWIEQFWNIVNVTSVISNLLVVTYDLELNLKATFHEKHDLDLNWTSVTEGKSMAEFPFKFENTR